MFLIKIQYIVDGKTHIGNLCDILFVVSEYRIFSKRYALESLFNNNIYIINMVNIVLFI